MQVVKNQIKAFLEEFIDPNRIKKKGFPTMSGVGPVGPKFKPNPQSKFRDERHVGFLLGDPSKLVSFHLRCNLQHLFYSRVLIQCP